MKSVCSCLWLVRGGAEPVARSKDKGQCGCARCVRGGAFLIEDPRESHVEVNEGVRSTGEAGQ